MPTKYKESVKNVNRATKETTMTHYYVKSLSNDSLLEIVTNDNTAPKLVDKLMNEVRRRKIETLLEG